ncbi:MAG: DNA polymerase IV [Pseudomonadales bacterium]|nr:DNA polymerase IV [Pseudomonadales bacterium]
MRKIIHIDCDCFFAAIEMRDDPSLKTLAVAVGGSVDRRGVISTCNYTARAFGVHSAMATNYALRICPQLVLIPHHFNKYKEASEGMHHIFQDYTDLIEPLSLDEAFLDVSASTHCSGSATLMAREIRQRIKKEIGITASAGIATNKFLAKIASDWNKPNGEFVILPTEIEGFVKNLPVNKLFGVGKVTAQKLQNLGIIYCSDLHRHDKIELTKIFGRFGERLHQLSRGIDDRQVNTSRSRKSVSIEHTYPNDLHGIDSCIKEIPRLYQSFQERQRKSSSQKSIHKAFVKVKFADFSTTTVERRADCPTLEAYQDLLKEAYSRAEQPVRLLGIGVRFKEEQYLGNLAQLELFPS